MHRKEQSKKTEDQVNNEEPERLLQARALLGRQQYAQPKQEKDRSNRARTPDRRGITRQDVKDMIETFQTHEIYQNTRTSSTTLPPTPSECDTECLRCDPLHCEVDVVPVTTDRPNPSSVLNASERVVEQLRGG